MCGGTCVPGQRVTLAMPSDNRMSLLHFSGLTLWLQIAKTKTNKQKLKASEEVQEVFLPQRGSRGALAWEAELWSPAWV